MCDVTRVTFWSSPPPVAEHYPYLLVSIGSGVSMVRVDGENKFQRVSGAGPCWGGACWGGFLSLCFVVSRRSCWRLTSHSKWLCVRQRVPFPNPGRLHSLRPPHPQAPTSAAARSGACASC